MSNEIAKKTVLKLDSISDYDDTVVGDNKDSRGSGGGGYLPEGTRIVFNFKKAFWQVKNGGDIITGKTVLLLDIIRTQIQWGPEGMPVAPPKILGPGEQFVDTDALNEAIDRSQWITDFNGNPKGPIENQNVVLLGDLRDMTRYVWPSPLGTASSATCVSKVSRQVKSMRQLRGPLVRAKVKLVTAPFPTRYDREQKGPCLQVIGWLAPSGDGLVEVDTDALPKQHQISQTNELPWVEVEEPALAEEMKDEIRY